MLLNQSRQNKLGVRKVLLIFKNKKLSTPVLGRQVDSFIFPVDMHRKVTRDLLGPIHRVPEEDGNLWAEFDARPAALLKKAVGTSVGSDGSGGSLCTLATARLPLAVLEVPLIAA